MELNKEQIEFLNRCTIIPRVGGPTRSKWTLNEKTGLVDIEGDFSCYHVYGEGLTDFKGVNFGVVTGRFNCQNNKLTSLEGAPQEVGGDFICRNNKITSLVGAPRKVGEFFDCSNNELTSLVGAPQEVGGPFDCGDNKLTSLEGAPQEVGGHFRYWGKGNQISDETLELVWEVMQKNKIDYWTALSALKSRIESDDWKKMSIGLDDRLSKDAQKGYSILARFGHFG